MSRFLVTTQKQIKEKDTEEDFLYKIVANIQYINQVVEFKNDNPTWKECNDLIEEYGIIIMMQRLEDEE